MRKLYFSALLLLALSHQWILRALTQAAAQQNTTYSCTVDFVPADQHTDQMAGWVAMTEVKSSKRATQKLTGITKSPDKRVADAACRDFFAERAKYRSPAEDTALGK